MSDRNEKPEADEESLQSAEPKKAAGTLADKAEDSSLPTESEPTHDSADGEPQNKREGNKESALAQKQEEVSDKQEKRDERRESSKPAAQDTQTKSEGDINETGEGSENSAPLGPATEASKAGQSSLAKLYAKIAPFEIFIVIALAMLILLPGMGGYSLIDPWETHYGEVARRILENNDWVLLKAEDISFRSKPVLTFWLIAASLQTFGIATDGGFSGEFLSTDWATFAVRLPFALFAVMGLTMVWFMLARLINRRVAWIAFLVLISTPFYVLVGRQAITDMPMVATLMGALSCFALASNHKDTGTGLKPIWKKITSLHLFVGALLVFVGGQILYLSLYFGSGNFRPAKGVKLPPALIIAVLAILLILLLLSFLPRLGTKGKSFELPSWLHVTSQRQVYMFWFFFFIGVSALAKGPPGVALAGLVCLLYTLLTGHWKKLLGLEIPRGIVITSLIAVPWHFAMFIRDGLPWYTEYFHHHMFKRFGKGVHGDNGTFDYFASQIGIGMWPWIALLPAALATVLYTANKNDKEGRVRLLIGIWAIAGYATFCVSETKFHHYILPAIPAIAILVAFWIDDFLLGKVRKSTLAIFVALPILALIGRDFVGEQKQLIELFIYRHDRPWPSGEPWNLDITGGFKFFAWLFAAVFVSMLWQNRRWRSFSVAALLLSGLAFGWWTMQRYMPAAGPHWGQREIHRAYYNDRDIHGVDFEYYSLRDLSDYWSGRSSLEVESYLPAGFATGQEMKVRIFVPGAGIPKDLVTLTGAVSKLGEHKFWIDIPAGELSKLNALMERGKNLKASNRKPWMQVNADRMIAWQLNWHGEDFWTAGEMYGNKEGAAEDTTTIFKKTDNKAFLKWIKNPKRQGRRFYIITEAGRAKNLKSVLPTPRAKESLTTVDTSCNKFTLVRFDL